MADSIDIIIDDKQLQSLLNNLARKGTNTAPLMKRLAFKLHQAVDDNFEKEGRPRWTPLKKSTILQRQKSGHVPIKILTRTENLRKSITQRPTKNEAVVRTSNKKYAAAQQFGYAKRNLPARPYLKVTQDDITGFVKITSDYIMENL